MPVSTLPGPSTCRRRAPSARDAETRWLDDPDVRLMLRACEGDADAFSQLAARYGSRVFGFFCRRLGDRQDAEDLTQEVMLRLFRARKNYRPRARFSTWVFHVTQNVARNALRFRQRHPSVRLSASDEDGLPRALHSGAADAPSRPLERAELAGVVRAAVAGLGERQRAALELHQFEDHTYAEVAARMHMTPKAAKSLLYRTRNQLRDRLTPLFGND
jgi:RNA polymerase sigma-70 factor (ECF subfamily)